MIGLIHTAAVYTPDNVTGAYTVLVNPSLLCRLTHVPTDSAKDAHERAELASVRRLLWDPAYQMPENARVVVANVDSPTWAVVAGTFAAIQGPGLAMAYRRCELVRVE